ncbi:MAG: hypothetical protein A3J29_06195 [Acidobacteria bacterium RIFCSPLOWO2_12_FULL_67_14b]|nr:MAG: hypothetical protein A3J29_06195 [Acidobacteria bacterium RIFCSPLOWO2_12_FULL_67_14b]
MPPPYDRLGRIAPPREGMPECGTPAQYAAVHSERLRARAEALPHLNFRAEPWPAPDGMAAVIYGGKWIVECPCGEIPMASPAWDEARCFECGAIYRRLALPADREAIEALLLQRPTAVTRTWLPGEPLDDLRAQNAAHGIGVAGVGAGRVEAG